MTSHARFVNATVRTSAAFELRSPFREADVRQLPLGATVSISGTIYTGRDRLHRYLADGGASPAYAKSLAVKGSARMGEGEYYACGDNSDNSLDSRYWGAVPERNLRGVGSCVFWPFMNPRWGKIK